MNLHTHLIVAAALFLLLACSDDLETITTNGEDITGGWASNCYNDGGNGAANTLSYSGDGLRILNDGWLTDTSCSGPPDFTFTGSSSITFVGAKVVSGMTVSTFRWTDTALNLISNNGATTAIYNAAGNYGFSNWSTGVAKSVLGISNTGGTQAVQGRDIIYVNVSTSPHTLQLGDETAATDSSGYPEALDTAVTYTRQ